MILKIAYCLLLTVFCSSSFSQIAKPWKFDFGSGNVQPGYIQVLPSTKYNAESGYGFDLNSSVISKTATGKDALRGDYITGEQPFYFSVKLPEGNYNVKVILGDRSGVSATTIKTECRRLMVEKVETAKGKFATAEFTVHVKDSLIKGTSNKVKLKSREINYLHWDDKLTLEFNSTAPKVCAVEISVAKNIPTVFL